MGLNDPQWGRKKGNSGPPDLDELWRNVNKKLNSLFKRKAGGGEGSGGGEGPAGGTPRRYSGGVGLLAGLLLLMWVSSGFYIVNEGQRGVVLRFGKYIETTQAGLRWHLPYPVEVVEAVNVSQVRTVEIGYRNNVRSKVLKESLMLTDDENIIDIQFAVQYILKNPEDFLFNNREPESAVMQAAETAIREVIGKSKMDFVLYEGREQVAAQTTKLMQEILDRYKIGVAISKVTMQNAQPPEQVQAAFDDARDDEAIGVVILTGAGQEAFCSGGDQRVRGKGGYVDEGGMPRLNVLDLSVGEPDIEEVVARIYRENAAAREAGEPSISRASAQRAESGDSGERMARGER